MEEGIYSELVSYLLRSLDSKNPKMVMIGSGEGLVDGSGREDGTIILFLASYHTASYYPSLPLLLLLPTGLN